jgi:hypothetical protein
LVAQHSVLLLTTDEISPTGNRLWQWSTVNGWSEQDAPPGRIIKGAGRAVGQAHALYLVSANPAVTLGTMLVSYHTITKSWATHGVLDTGSIGSVAAWKNGFISAEPSAKGHGINFSYTHIDSGEQRLNPIDWGVIAIYTILVMGVGLYFYTQDARGSTASYFLGGRSIPFWAAGISMYASNVSALSFIGIPAKSFATNWQY